MGYKSFVAAQHQAKVSVPQFFPGWCVDRHCRRCRRKAAGIDDDIPVDPSPSPRGAAAELLSSLTNPERGAPSGHGLAPALTVVAVMFRSLRLATIGNISFCCFVGKGTSWEQGS